MIKTLLPLIMGCHQMPSRSFKCQGKPFIICARCTGEVAGFLLGLGLIFIYVLHPLIAAVMTLPLIIDGTVQLKTRYESNNLKRFITGSLAGLGVFYLFYHVIIFLFTQFQINLTVALQALLVNGLFLGFIKIFNLMQYRFLRMLLLVTSMIVFIMFGNIIFHLGVSIGNRL